MFVNDGSSDATELVIASLIRDHANAHTLTLSRNSGKAEAVRQGVLWALETADPDCVGYLDADLSTPVREFARLVSRLDQQSELEIVMGSRIQRLGVRIRRNPLRHYLGRVAATAISLVLRLAVYDTQCGAKLFRSSLATGIFSQPFQSRWLFDVELLARSRNRLGPDLLEKVVLEEPLCEWLEKAGSKIRVRDLLRLPMETWKIHRLYNGPK